VPYYHEHLADQSRPFPGVVETLEHFRGKKKVVCTNKGHGPTERMLRDLKLIQYFEAYYGDGAGLPLKPDPGGLLAICERFGVTPARAAMIGDAETDIRAAQAAGAAAFVASYGYRDRDALERLNPTAVFVSFADLRLLIV
jgi:phosphoglycolate phosphatase